MGRVWTNYALKYTRAVIKNPTGIAFCPVMFAFVAGSVSEHIWDNSAKHQTIAIGFFLLCIFTACWMSYFLARTIRQLRDGSMN